ncbi:transmembrane protease serine 9-like [Paramacrobiotus metropolitanus]|uniref:transmembrane protease serine 9-like n=1 Tax=Paramacrobiotus metropolitanus TaxID=2943436 RepID=UPI0024457C51|nr:transmembrane protease serine 9-like [Paramacrobiotus metropolitanus]
MFTTSVFALCAVLTISCVSAQNTNTMPTPYNLQSYDSDRAMQNFSGQESGAFYSHPGFYSYPRQPYVAGTRKRFIITLPTYCRAQLSLDMTNTYTFNIRDYDFGVMFDGKLATNIGTTMCDQKSYMNLQQKGTNYQSVTTSDKSATRTFLSSTNVAVFDFCADPYNLDNDPTRRLGFAISWNCIRTPTNPNPTTTTTTTTPQPTVTNPAVANCGVPINSNNRPSTAFQTEASTRIVGGVPAASNSWPWAVGLINTQYGGQFCDATVLNSQWVVTAAHCVNTSTEAKFQQNVKVYYGSQNLLNSQQASVARVICHPNYNTGNQPFSNDVALIKLTAPIPNFPNSMVSPICLPSQAIGTFQAQSYNRTTGRPFAYVAGWGTIQSGQQNSDAAIGSGSDQLRQTNIDIFSSTDCHKAYDYGNTRFPDTAICGGITEGGRDSCQGDSGGPLVMAVPPTYNSYALYGIVSFGAGCAQAGLPGAYTDVFQLKKWITDSMADPRNQ